MTDKDRETIKKHKHIGYNTEEVSEAKVLPGYKRKKHFILSKRDDSGVTVRFKSANYNRKLSKGTSQEHKEHPSLSKKEAQQVASDHLKENPDYYDNPSSDGVRYIIEGRKWRDKINGNTYHSVVIVDAKTNEEVYHSPMTYGYGRQYEETAKDYLIKTGRMNESDRHNHEVNRKRLYITEKDVNKRDL